jgi:DNA-binding MarR family transcriptional regulator
MLKPTATDPVLEQCAREVMETVPLVMRAIRAEMRRQRTRTLSVPQFRALIFLSRQPGASLSSLAEYLGVTRPTASALVDRLVRRGLVTRTTHPRERRRLVLALTPSGTRHLQRARDVARGRLAAMLADLSPADLRKVAEGMALLQGAFKETRAAPGG